MLIESGVKKKKKLLSLSLTLVMLFSLSINAYATSVSPEQSIQAYSYLAESVVLETQNSDTILSDYAIDTLSFGNIISTYNFEGGQLSPAKVTYIPIFSNSSLVAMACVTERNGSIIGVELSNDLMAELGPYVYENICLIFSNAEVYLYTNGKAQFLKSYAPIISSNKSDPSISLTNISTQLSLESSLSTNSVITEEFAPTYSLLSFSDGLISPMDYPTSSNIGAEIIPQNGLPICWAAAVASIGLELTGTRHTAEYVSDWMYGESRGGNTYAALLCLQGIYGLSGVDIYFAPDFAVIMDMISISRTPIYVRVYGGSMSNTLNHALFIDGYTNFSSGSYDGRLSVGDPNYTSYRSYIL